MNIIKETIIYILIIGLALALAFSISWLIQEGCEKEHNHNEHSQLFINKISIYAVNIQKKYGVPASIAIAQCIHESGWGKNVKGNNYFGIKGKGQKITSHEYENGYKIKVNTEFKIYMNIQDSFNDYAKKLCTNRYKKAMAVRKNPYLFIKEVKNCGYATDPNYINLIWTLVKQYNLTKFDI